MRKSYGFVWSLLFVLAVRAQAVTVSLAATPPGIANAGSPISLIVRTSGKDAGGSTFSYEAERTWPCHKVIPIAGTGPSTTWTPSKAEAGEYTLWVTVSEKLIVPAAAPVRMKANVPYVVNNPGLGKVGFSSSQIEDSNGHLHYSVTAKVGQAPAGYVYRFRITCQQGCTSSTRQSGENFTILSFSPYQLLNFSVHVDAVKQTDCIVISSDTATYSMAQ